LGPLHIISLAAVARVHHQHQAFLLTKAPFLNSTIEFEGEIQPSFFPSSESYNPLYLVVETVNFTSADLPN